MEAGTISFCEAQPEGPSIYLTYGRLKTGLRLACESAMEHREFRPSDFGLSHEPVHPAPCTLQVI